MGWPVKGKEWESERGLVSGWETYSMDDISSTSERVRGAEQVKFSQR